MNSFIIPKTGNGWFIFIIRVIIGAVFIYASIDKIIHPNAFGEAIHNYRILVPGLINILAIFLPWLELIAGFALITGWRYRGANLIIFFMLIGFIIALSIAYSRGLNINCGCFSTSPNAKSNLVWRIVEDTLMLIGCLIIMFNSRFFTKRSKAALETA